MPTMTTKDIHDKIIGQRIVAIEGRAEWDGTWLVEPIFVLENGVRLDPQEEPVIVRMPSEGA